MDGAVENLSKLDTKSTNKITLPRSSTNRLASRKVIVRNCPSRVWFISSSEFDADRNKGERNGLIMRKQNSIESGLKVRSEKI